MYQLKQKMCKEKLSVVHSAFLRVTEKPNILSTLFVILLFINYHHMLIMLIILILQNQLNLLMNKVKKDGQQEEL